MWDDLKHKIEGLEPYRALLKKLGPEGASVPVAGLYGSARSLVVAALASARRAPFIIIAPDPVRARDVEEDLRIFGVQGVVPYPEDEILPYDYHDPDRSLTGLQMEALDALGSGRCRVLVCTLRSALKKVFPRGLFRTLLVDVRAGEERDPHELAERLVRLGYERHETVEAKGQFALRGGILDIFEVAGETPVRMEFDGDEIVSMRDFDIETQRSTGSRESVRIHPPAHIAPTPEGIARLVERIRAETEGASDEERARLMLPAERLEKGISFFGMEHYAAVVHDVVPLFAHFDEPPDVVLVDAEDIESALADFREEIALRYARTRGEGNLYPAPDEAYVGERELAEWLDRSRRVSIHKLEWEGALRFGTSSPGDYRRNLAALVTDVQKELKRGNAVYFFCASTFQRERAEELLEDIAMEIDFPIGNLSSGFRWPEIGVFFLSEEEVFGRYHRPYHTPPARSRSLAYDPSHFQPGDFVVHVNHGIGRYMGMRVLDIECGKTECLDMRYGGDDHLFIPIGQLRLVEKYVAAEDATPQLDRLGSASWTRTRERARKSAEKIARDLLEVYAARQLAKGFSFPADKPWQQEMEASFPFEETNHQLRATAEVKGDMESPRPMDRLLCGDVGFGKTEVAVRAAFKAALSGKQVAILVPTTVLAMQHTTTVSERLAGYPVTVSTLSRFVSNAKQKEAVEAVKEGKVDIVVGTHRLLSKDVQFKDLGLVIIDEEHRFGVRHKEKFKKLKKSVDVLTHDRDADPAHPLDGDLGDPRYLGDRHAAAQPSSHSDRDCRRSTTRAIRDACMREIDRGGQVFFVHNRVQSIAVMEGYLRRLLPDRVRIAHAHGQMPERELERLMIDFLERKFDVLVCTMIIEVGARFPEREHDRHQPRRPLRARPDLPAPRARRTVGPQGVRLSPRPARPRAHPDGRQAAPGDQRVRLPRRRLPDRDARSRDPRGRQPPRRRAVGEHRRGRPRSLHAHAQGGGRAPQGGAGRDGARGAHLGPPAGLSPLRIRHRFGGADGHLPAALADRDRRPGRRDGGGAPRPLRPAPRERRQHAQDRRAQGARRRGGRRPDRNRPLARPQGGFRERPAPGQEADRRDRGSLSGAADIPHQGGLRADREGGAVRRGRLRSPPRPRKSVEIAGIF